MKQIIIITLLAFLLNGCMLRHIFHGHGGGYSNGSSRGYSSGNSNSRDTGRFNRGSSRDSRDYRR